MDRALDERWRNGGQPFAGEMLTISTPDPRLGREAVAYIVRTIAALSALEDLRTQWDFHDHDGYVSDLTHASWSDLEFATRSDDAFLDIVASKPGVCRLWSPLSHTWMLRWGMDEFGMIRIDLLGDNVLLTSTQLLLERAVDVDVVQRPAQRFFTAAWKLMSRSGGAR